MQALLQNKRGPGEMDGWLYRADTRAKVVISVLASLLTIFLANPAAQLLLLLFALLYAAGMRRPKLLAAAFFICVALFCIAFGCTRLLNLFIRMPATAPAMAIPFLRLMITACVVLPLALSTPVQTIMTALKSIRLPFCIYIPLTVMVRFIPTLLTDFKQISEALRIRGYSLNWKQLILHPVLSMRFITTPLLFRALKTSEDLGIAAELKGLAARRKPSPYRTLTWKQSDTLLLAGAVLAAAAAVAVAWLVPAELILGNVRGGMR